ncbi:acetyl-CoA synthetase-like protein [Sistotremastrum suecicum HHB10207 ss-3]|uniref:Acetyl-CoA synthetase-like protein n=1 Tax=Sistotremastrum suecicum HHB10207 ss-3 TaxID=1314776 RepID=A0A166G7T1_9AGAM|nr:acetyl-CoA synthetase-like protein [Sistotremastrum suecicum HHB10207 ss-3]
MPATLRSHLIALQSAVHSAPEAIFYRKLKSCPPSPPQWDRISYSQFYLHVQKAASYWTEILNARGIKKGDVVAAWLLGMSYDDVVVVFGLSLAGFIPQLISLRLTNSDVVTQLLIKGESKAVIHETSYGNIMLSVDIPVFSNVTAEAIDDLNIPPRQFDIAETHGREDRAFIFHTSGSTSGSPKLVPNRYGWIDGLWPKAKACWSSCSDEGQDILPCIGSICHVGQMFLVLSAFQRSACIVQPTSLPYSPSEFQTMIRDCGVNRLYVFSPILSRYVQLAKTDASVLQSMKSLRQVLYTGLPLAEEDATWAFKQGIKLLNMFGSTECGPLLSSSAHADPAAGLKALPGTAYRFVPIDENDRSPERLLELVVLETSSDIPDKSLLEPDGTYRTGDLFSRVSRGLYISRGRNDDWIKSLNSLRCDTKSLEENVRATCSDLILDCVVVGNERASPALFVEPRISMDFTELSQLIIDRIRPFHSRLYLHERITNSNLVLIVEAGTLPRTATKGNIRRRQVEHDFKDRLDTVYASVSRL